MGVNTGEVILADTALHHREPRKKRKAKIGKIAGLIFVGVLLYSAAHGLLVGSYYAAESFFGLAR